MKCTECETELDIGRDIIRVEVGVVGTRGFVPLEDAEQFCNEDCLRKRFHADGTLIDRTRRVP